MRVDEQEIAFRVKFAKRLTAAIQKRGYSREGAAKATGVGETTVYKYTNADVYATLFNAVKLAKGLNVSLDWLCGFKARAAECVYDEIDPGWRCNKCEYYAEGEQAKAYKFCPGCGSQIMCKIPRI